MFFLTEFSLKIKILLMILVISLFHFFITIWFGFSLHLNLILFTVDFILIIIGILMDRITNPGNSSDHSSELDGELNIYLKKSSPMFQEKVKKCQVLINQIKNEFQKDNEYAEIQSILSNIKKISFNHQLIYQRYLNFGDKKQKEEMKRQIDGHIKWMDELYEMLLTYSGNLTLIDVKTKELPAENRLKYINDTLNLYITGGGNHE